ncbi:MAG: rhodanese-like domain-containing protein [Planctomycetota bacterium]|jgi:adenylyltransferase/sulfurtransferase
MIERIEPVDLKARLDAGEDLVLVDVREDQELEICKIEGALHIPLSEFQARFEELDREHSIVCICHHGMRSANAAGFLAEQGYERLINLTGGIDAWAGQVDPEMARY